jgi:L-ribulokinase
MGTRSSEGRHTHGLDFGTESARAVVVDMGTGAVGGAAGPPTATPMVSSRAPGRALQDPADWLAALEATVPAALAESGLAPQAIAGVGLDFTACTLLLCTGDGTPLCALESYRARPHAWPKLWKHHAARAPGRGRGPRIAPRARPCTGPTGSCTTPSGAAERTRCDGSPRCGAPSGGRTG